MHVARIFRRCALQPSGEIPGIIGKGAHVRGADIQKMIRVPGAIGGALPGVLGALAQDDAMTLRKHAVELECDDRAGETGADNGDGRCVSGQGAPDSYYPQFLIQPPAMPYSTNA